MEINLTEVPHLAETPESHPAAPNDRELPESRASGLVALCSEPPAAPEAGSLPPITEGFEGAFCPGAAASFDLSKSAPGNALPESVRLTARLI